MMSVYKDIYSHQHLKNYFINQFPEFKQFKFIDMDKPNTIISKLLKSINFKQDINDKVILSLLNSFPAQIEHKLENIILTEVLNDITLLKQFDINLVEFKKLLQKFKQKDEYCLLLLFSYMHYNKMNTQHNLVDFTDLIINATDSIAENKSDTKQILIDEFQDISSVRAKFLNKIKQSSNGAHLFCVADDWQSIYQFTGSNILYTINFSHYFGETTTTHLDVSYRCNNQILAIANKFVSKNEIQLDKIVIANNVTDKNSIWVHASNNENEYLNLFDNLALQYKSLSILILARYKVDLPTETEQYELHNKYPKFSLKFSTCHSAKGLEADCVILLNLTDNKHGFPATKPVSIVQHMLVEKIDTIDLAEERRLFYVALTRARNQIHLYTDAKMSSPFLQEIIHDNAKSIIICTETDNTER
ncbi:3'-5' exonuclease [Shewanella marina]|uniref:3'-5' exonuclease n=1 Tax=Shewanella marina TaxID=487319 RepID=UPI00131EEE54|nr:3'-5' exonuclease [Shewanella marina]